jgi:hypothetical protein
VLVPPPHHPERLQNPGKTHENEGALIFKKESKCNPALILALV